MDLIEVYRYCMHSCCRHSSRGSSPASTCRLATSDVLNAPRQTPSLVPSGRVYPAYGPLPVSQNLDPPLVIVIMYFRIKVLKRFIGDILPVVILDFSTDILTLSVQIWWPGLVQKKLWSAWVSAAITALPYGSVSLGYCSFTAIWIATCSIPEVRWLA